MDRMVLAGQREPGALESIQEALVDHRPVEDLTGRIADRGSLHRAREPIEELVVYLLVCDHRPERGAPLAGGPKAAEQRPLDG